ncbi:hypothetical protein ACLOJK_034572 [Asimina triloba]
MGRPRTGQAASAIVELPWPAVIFHQQRRLHHHDSDPARQQGMPKSSVFKQRSPSLDAAADDQLDQTASSTG